MKNINIQTKTEKTQQVKSKGRKMSIKFQQINISLTNHIFKEIQRNPISYNNRNRIQLSLEIRNTKYTIILGNFTVHDSFSDKLVEEGATPES